jgi:hypothetical protein
MIFKRFIFKTLNFGKISKFAKLLYLGKKLANFTNFYRVYYLFYSLIILKCLIN